MKSLILFLFLMSSGVIYAQKVQYLRNGNIFTEITEVKKPQHIIKTEYIWKSENLEYPIIVTPEGNCYIIKVSYKGYKYRYYLPEEVSKEICNELGIKYINSK